MLPASKQDAPEMGIERPIDVKIGPDGAMYIVDHGIANINGARGAEGQVPYESPPRRGPSGGSRGRPRATSVPGPCRRRRGPGPTNRRSQLEE